MTRLLTVVPNPGAVAAVLVSISGGGVTAMAMDKSLTVDVDGSTVTFQVKHFSGYIIATGGRGRGGGRKDK